MERPAPRKIILDTDTGADDALAIILAALSLELHVEAITTVSGNVHVNLCTRNALLVLEQLGVPNPPPVCRGSDKPLAKSLFTAPEVHGYDGLGQITHIENPDGSRKYPEPSIAASPVGAVDMILDLADRLGPDLTLVTVGPLTNIAHAIHRDRKAMSTVGGIVLMGGAYRVSGNTGPVAEFNIFVDPHAAQEVLELGVPITVVPLDVTERTVLMRAELDTRLAYNPTKPLEMVRDIADFYMTFQTSLDNLDGCFMHDPLAVGAAIHPEFLQTVDAFVRVERKGEWTQGMTVVETRLNQNNLSPNVKWAVDVDSRAFLDFFLGRLAC